jgi:glycosyltransferase involved in cell wall biosynthesis
MLFLQRFQVPGSSGSFRIVRSQKPCVQIIVKIGEDVKIAIIAPYWNPPQFVGGVSKVIYELRKLWIDDGHTVHVYASTVAPDPEAGIYKLPVLRTPLRAVWNALYLKFFHKLVAYDVVFPQSGCSSLFMAGSCCIPFVHTLSVVESRSWFRPWKFLHPGLESYALRRVTAVVTLSDDVVEILATKFGIERKNILQVFNGVDGKRFSPPDPVIRKEEDADFVILSAGRLIPRKRFDLLITAFSQFARKVSGPVSLRIAGAGEQQSYLSQLAQSLGIREQVVFLGQLNETELLREYAHCSVFVLASRAEGLPMVVLEAMAMECPVVLGNFATAGMLVANGVEGFVVEGEEPARWLEAFETLYADGAKRLAMGRQARSRVLQDFSWRVPAAAIMAFFEQQLAASREG